MVECAACVLLMLWILMPAKLAQGSHGLRTCRVAGASADIHFGVGFSRSMFCACAMPDKPNTAAAKIQNNLRIITTLI